METISLEGSKAEIKPEGAYMSSLLLDGKEIIKESKDGHQTHGGAAVLIPYAGRVRNARYVYEGTEYNLPKNNGENSIHGFLKNLKWDVRENEGTSVLLSCEFSDPGYPTSIRADVNYELEKNKLTVSTAILNTGGKTAPLLIGFHPYFRISGDWSIKHTSELEQLNFVDGYFPDGTSTPVDFNGLTRMNDMEFDSCFRGGGAVSLRSDSFTMRMERENMPYLVVYNGTYSEGKSVAIEPMTGAPDSFNNGIGRIDLHSSEEFRCSYSIEVE